MTTYNPHILYKNLRRPEVDAIFEEKNELINDIQFYKDKISITENKFEKEALQNKIDKNIKRANSLDKKARELWKEIQIKSQNQI